MGSTTINPSVPPPNTSTGSTSGPGGDTTTRPPDAGTTKPADGANQPPPAGSDARGADAPVRDTSPPPPNPTGQPNNPAALFNQEVVANMGANQELASSIMDGQNFQTQNSDQQAGVKQSDSDRPQDNESRLTNNAEKVFMRSDQDLQAMRQRQFQNLLSNQQKEGQYSETHHQTETRTPGGEAKGEDATLKQQQFFRSRGSFSQGLAKENTGAPWKQMQFKAQLPKGYNAYMGDGPRGRFISIASEKALKWKQFGDEKGESVLKEALKEDGEPKSQQTRAGMNAAQKKLSKMMGQKEGADEAKEEEEILETEAEEESGEIEEGNTDGLDSMRKAMQAKAAKTKGKGEDGEGVPEDRTGMSFQQLIEDHNLLLVAADHTESATLVSQAQFAGAIIMGAGLHIRLKGARLN